MYPLGIKKALKQGLATLILEDTVLPSLVQTLIKYRTKVVQPGTKVSHWEYCPSDKLLYL